MPEVVIITGMSGAGRTEAMHVFEDLGYYCVDNLPPHLIPEMVDLMCNSEHGEPKRKLALICDARNGNYFGFLDEQLKSLRDEGVDVHVLFLDANDEKLVARYKSSRRRHPMCTDGTTIFQGIQRERNLLMGIRDQSDRVIDTTDMLPQQLRSKIRSMFSSASQRSGLAVTVYSFGYKHGAPIDADLVMDVRFLPNPYYDPELRHFTGLDAPVRDFVMYREETIEFVKKWNELLDVVMPGYVNEGKQQLAIAIGCTGGQHRSVALAENTGDYLRTKGYRVSVAHRDLDLAEVKAGANEA
ncbi:MAG: RNase adapter RapZ [Eggerthellaceae bacterium]|nr:RNase adapter RapZ [Eggerthellaceae bacterium]